MAKWECQDLRDVKEFLHMHITHTRTGITIDQCDYLEKVLTRFQLTDAKPAITPLPTSQEPTVAQKTAPMFAYYIKTHVLLNADII